MNLEVKLEKPDDSALWGFRLTGGCEFDVPIIVIKITENSIAESAGIQPGDIFEKINDVPTSELTHNDVHNVLLSAGNVLNLVIRRGDHEMTPLISQILSDKNDEEIAQYLQDPVTDEQISYQHEVQIQNEINLAKSAQSGNVAQKSSQEPEEKTVKLKPNDRKWSTFLQKPPHNKLVPRKKENDNIPKSAPYRVVIKKQPKPVPKKPPNIEENAESRNEGTTEEEPETVNNETEEVAEELAEEIEADVELETFHISEEIKEDNIVETTDSVNDEPECEEPNIIEEVIEQQEHEVVSKRRLLEEKLAAIQKQLEQLSQLPTSIQDNLDSITKQLASIVHEEEMGAFEDEEVRSQSSDGNTRTENDVTRQEASDEEGEKEEVPVELEVINEEDNVEELRVDEIEEDAVQEVVEELPPEETEEEKEAKRLQEEMLKKQEKQRPSSPLKPIDRPIILPGGRRWSQPDDACPAVRHPKMSDEKIANTIETFSEVISGKMKGINFMKYQLPPKKLDYLKNSEVFKMIHDNDQPHQRGVGNRDYKVLAEQDYYEKV